MKQELEVTKRVKLHFIGHYLHRFIFKVLFNLKTPEFSISVSKSIFNALTTKRFNRFHKIWNEGTYLKTFCSPVFKVFIYFSSSKWNNSFQLNWLNGWSYKNGNYSQEKEQNIYNVSVDDILL